MKKVNDVVRDKALIREHKAVLRHSIVGKYTTTKPPRLAKSMEGTTAIGLRNGNKLAKWIIYGGIGAQVSR
jgi:hypothetical protein